MPGYKREVAEDYDSDDIYDRSVSILFVWTFA